MGPKLLEFLGNLTPESSTYDSYILFADSSEALWYFLCLTLGGLFCTLFLKQPEKD